MMSEDEGNPAALQQSAGDLTSEAYRVETEAQRRNAAGNSSKQADDRSFLQRVLREGVIIAALVAIGIAGANWFIAQADPNSRMFTPKTLARFNGQGPPTHSKRIYLSILGSVFDVTAGARHYGPGNNYHGAAGRDSSKGFVSGDFKKDQSDDLSDAKPEELASVYRWRNFFRDHKTYKPVGKLAGRYYTAKGAPTAELQRIEKVGSEAADKAAETANPAGDNVCNVQWSKHGGKTVWCSEGKGYPRRVADADTSMDRCLCAPTPAPESAVLKLYADCAPDATKCVVPDVVDTL